MYESLWVRKSPSEYEKHILSIKLLGKTLQQLNLTSLKKKTFNEDRGNWATLCFVEMFKLKKSATKVTNLPNPVRTTTDRISGRLYPSPSIVLPRLRFALLARDLRRFPSENGEQQLWDYCRQEQHETGIHSIFCVYVLHPKAVWNHCTVIIGYCDFLGLEIALWGLVTYSVPGSPSDLNTGHRIEGPTACPSWCRPLRPLFHFLSSNLKVNPVHTILLSL